MVCPLFSQKALLITFAENLTLREAGVLSCVGRHLAAEAVPQHALQAMVVASRVVELPVSQNMEVSADGCTVLNTVTAPFRHFTRTACVSIQLAFARRGLQVGAAGSRRLVL